MRAALRTAIERMEEINEEAASEDRDFNEAEQTEYSELEGRCDTLQKRIERQEQLRERRSSAPMPAQADTRNAPQIHSVRDYDATDFRNLGEFVQSIRFNPGDQRLRGQSVEERADLTVGTDATGGFLVPETFRSELLEVTADEALVRPRATVIPAGNPPDGVIRLPYLDQSGTKGVYSGVAVTWIDEGAEKPDTNPTFGEITLEPHEVAATTTLTDKLLRNAPVAEAAVRRLLRAAIFAAEDVAFISGDGTGKPTGFVGHGSNIEVARATADTVTYADLVEMYSRMLFGGSPVWAVTQRALPVLMSIEDTEGHLIWQPSMSAAVPATIFGFPVVISNRMPALGALGDVAFVDFDYYVIKDGSPLVVAASEHVKFTSNKTVIKAFWMVDGKPWLTTPIEAENGELVSPFVVLDVPTV